MARQGLSKEPRARKSQTPGKNKDWNILGGPKIHILSCRTQSLGNREADVKCETWEEWRCLGRDQGRQEKSFCFRYIINHLIES